MKEPASVLRIFVERGCRGCGRAMELVRWVRDARPDVPIETIDVSEREDAFEEAVFAVPAYFYAGRQLFLGNPSRGELQDWLDSLNPEA